MQFYSAKLDSFGKTFSNNNIPEVFIPLYFADTSYIATNQLASANYYVSINGTPDATSNSGKWLFKFLNTSLWDANTKFALQATLMTNNTSATATVELWNFTASSVVATASVSTNQTVPQKLRSPTFTLQKNAYYGLRISISNTSYSTFLSDAWLVPFK